jgi:hypothetical protein
MFLLVVTVIAALGLAYAVSMVAGRVSSVLSEAQRKATAEEEGSRREELERTRPGGAPEHPIEVVSPAEVEVRARAAPCARCGSDVRVEEHVAETFGVTRVRVARVACGYCGAKRAVYFRIREPS